MSPSSSAWNSDRTPFVQTHRVRTQVIALAGQPDFQEWRRRNGMAGAHGYGFAGADLGDQFRIVDVPQHILGNHRFERIANRRDGSSGGVEPGRAGSLPWRDAS